MPPPLPFALPPPPPRFFLFTSPPPSSHPWFEGKDSQRVSSSYLSLVPLLLLLLFGNGESDRNYEKMAVHQKADRLYCSIGTSLDIRLR